jgi:hypothetical protein
MIKPSPAETSQRKAPTLTCCSAKAGVVTPRAIAAAVKPRTTLIFMGLFLSVWTRDRTDATSVAGVARPWASALLTA